MCSNVPGRTAPEMCEPCGKKGASTVATIYCASCDEFQCMECKKAHALYSVMKNHELVKASESKRHLVGLHLCDEHKNDIRYFCEDDNQLCCEICAFMKHRNCQKVTEIKTYARSSSHDVDTLIDAMCDIQGTVTSYRSILGKNKEDLNSQVERVLERSDTFQTKLNESFDDMLRNVSKEANAVMAERVETITERQIKYITIYSEIQDLLINMKEISEMGTPEQMFIAQHKLAEIYKSYVEKINDESSTTDSLGFELDFEKLFCDSSEETEDLYHLNVLKTKQSVKKEEELLGIAMDEVVSRDLSKTGDISVPFYTGIDFLLDGRLVAADNKNRKLVIFSQKLEVMGEYKLSEPPCCLSASKENEVAVTYSGGLRIEIYFVSSSNKLFMFRDIKTASSFNYICQNGDSGFIAGCKNDQRFVKCLSPNGEENDLDIDFPSKPLSVEYFSCTYVENLKKLVITERDKNMVYIFNIETKEKLVVNDSRIKKPRVATTGPFDIIFVICNDGDLVQISPLGRVLSIQNIGILFPSSICVSKHVNMLVVCSKFTDNNTINGGEIKLLKLKY